MKQYSVKQYNTINTIQYEAMLYEAIQNTEKCKCSSDSVSDTLYYEQSDAQDMHDESSRPLSLQTATGATKPTIGSPCTTFTAHMAVYVNRNVDWRAIECSQPSRLPPSAHEPRPQPKLLDFQDAAAVPDHQNLLCKRVQSVTEDVPPMCRCRSSPRCAAE